MEFNKHFEIKDRHSFLSASKYHWINYSMERLEEVYKNEKAKQLGTRLHALASEHIQLGIPMPDSKETLNMFVNDAIRLGMSSEVPLKYSENAFGTADAISFDGNALRIHDLKTGKGDVHFEQLMVYAAYFCLEYDIHPQDISIILVLYHLDDTETMRADPNEVAMIMNKIIAFDKRITELNTLMGY